MVQYNTTLAPGGLPGATAATRYAGGTTTGAPVSGTFSAGDYVIAQDGSVWVCTVAGSPGTWVQAGSLLAGLTVTTGSAVISDGSTKEYRLRTSGGSLDFESSGADLIMSVWSAFAFGGTQRNYLRFTSGAQALIMAGKVNHVAADLFGATVASVDPTTGTTGQMTIGQVVCATGNAISQGTGAPSKPNNVNPVAGDIWFRTDTPGTVNQRIYICTTGGGAPVWAALAV